MSPSNLEKEMEKTKQRLAQIRYSDPRLDQLAELKEKEYQQQRKEEQKRRQLQEQENKIREDQRQRELQQQLEEQKREIERKRREIEQKHKELQEQRQKELEEQEKKEQVELEQLKQARLLKEQQAELEQIQNELKQKEASKTKQEPGEQKKKEAETKQRQREPEKKQTKPQTKEKPVVCQLTQTTKARVVTRPTRRQSIAPTLYKKEKETNSITVPIIKESQKNKTTSAVLQNLLELSQEVENSQVTLADELLYPHTSFMTHLTSRLTHLKVIRRVWSNGDIRGAVETCSRMNDPCAVVHILNRLAEKSEEYTLDMCVLLIPLCNDLLSEKKCEEFVVVALNTVENLAKQFISVIKKTLSNDDVPLDSSSDDK